MRTSRVESVEDWQAVAQNVAHDVKPGTILELSGPLGAGKTTFVQALAKALGAKSRPKSPTFALVRRYVLRDTGYGLRALVHVDAYRIERPEDVQTLGLDELLAEPDTIMVIEWPENVQGWLARQRAPRIRLSIEVGVGGVRTVTRS